MSVTTTTSPRTSTSFSITTSKITIPGTTTASQAATSITTSSQTSQQPTNSPAFAQAVVRMQSVTNLSDNEIIIYIEEFSKLIQANVNKNIKMTVKKIQKVSP
ncbi:hypothetical protein HF521_022145 [Silurus meridionalis]|uniref:Uncharacterized protein n=2 Tax=Silurus meridionalis TaxID=175797 RepID=A0A8T0B852_SILME|nr:hypothetical protein HF521_022145 [Silurus meridionalis]